MILEVADIRIHPGQNAAFEEAAQKGLSTVISKAQGFQNYKVSRGIESPQRYLLQIHWDSLEAHAAFRASEQFPQWRGFVGPFFAGAPTVEHFELAIQSD